MTSLTWVTSAALDLLAQGPKPGSVGVQAASPFTDFTAAAVIYTLIIAGLVIFLLGGAFLILNLGLMSKREEDRIGARTPSDVGILKTSVWPAEPEERKVLPAYDQHDPYSVSATRGDLVTDEPEADLHEGELISQLGNPIAPDSERDEEGSQRPKAA